MLKWLRERWREFWRKREEARAIRPDAFHGLARELLELAELAARLWPEEHEFQVKISNIRQEMGQLYELADKPEFKLLPPERLQELKKSLIHSRQQLLDSVSQAPPPTSRPQ